MYHLIEFAVDVVIDFEGERGRRRKQTVLPKGHRQRAEARAYVLETKDGPTEVADLLFEDGTSCRAVPYAYFAFAE